MRLFFYSNKTNWMFQWGINWNFGSSGKFG